MKQVTSLYKKISQSIICNLILCGLFVWAGIDTAVRPESVSDTCIILFGVLLCVSGINQLLKTLNNVLDTDLSGADEE